MTPVFPIHLFRVHDLADVPRSVYSDAPRCEDPFDSEKRRNFLARLRRGPASHNGQPSPTQTYQYEFNAAVWMHFARQPNKPISLALVYRDSQGEYGVIVDEVGVSETGAAMLSGNVTIESRGPLQHLRACCLGLESAPPFSVEELYVQRTNTEGTVGEKRRLA